MRFTVAGMPVVLTDYRSAASAAAKFVPGLGDVAEMLSGAGVADGFPFVVDGGGVYDCDLNRILRLLPGYGVRSHRSVRAYADIYVAFGRFLAERRGGKGLWDVTREDFQALHQVRRVDLATCQSKATWNLWVAALDKLYRVAVDEGLMAANPLPHRLGVAWGRSGPVAADRNAAYEPDGGERPVKYLSLDQYRDWRNLGVVGAAPPLPRLRERNAAFVDLMLATGLRLQEASSLLTVEVCGSPTGGPWRFELGAATAKGSKSRRVTIPSRVRRELVAYLRVERASAVAAGRRRGVYAESGWLRVSAAGPSGLRVGEGRTRRLSLHDVGPADRARLLLVDGDGAPSGPLQLWLSESGRPVSAAAWERVFDRANDRAGACGGPMGAHPHTLRHSFAVHMLGLLVQRVVSVALPDGLVGIRPDTALYTRVITDPLRQLQRLLGHANSESTEVYLTCLDLAQKIVDGAIADLDEAIPLEEYEVPG